MLAFHLPRRKTPDDDIGISGTPNYPKDFIGLTLVAFTHEKIKKEAKELVSKEKTKITTSHRD